MAGARSGRARPTKSYADSDAESAIYTDTEETAARPARNGVKRRLSEYVDGDGTENASFASTENGGRPPLKSVNMNDDAAEKRRRRKSAKIVLPTGDEPEAHVGAPDENAPQPGKGLQRLQSVAQVPIANVPLESMDVMSSNFEEWMKMATDNKINAANSWNFALIDYFHDMSLLRNTSDNSINFQRASCTLDGCVKIWTSRVDSVGTETGKLLSNLAQDGGRGSSSDDEGEEGAMSDGAGAGEDGGSQRKRKARGAGETLAKNAAQLKSKKLELEFSVDPLFRKTCADFDEGGAQGLLMSHLALGVGPDGGLRIVFDASDAVAKDAEEEDIPEPDESVDLSYLRQTFLPQLDDLEDRAIAHSLGGFSFSQDSVSLDDATFFIPAVPDVDDDDDGFGGEFLPNEDGGMDEDGGAGAGEVEDFFVGEQAVTDDFMPPGMDDFGGSPADDGDAHEDGAIGAMAGHHGGGGSGGTFVPFDPRRAPNERDLVMAMTENEGGMLDYFDQAFLKNWAGPQHWKLRKAVRRPDATEAQAAKPKREKKEAFKIDFTTPAEKSLKETSQSLFAPVTRGAGINLPGTSARSRKGKKGSAKDKDLHLLPDDMHFSSRQLVTLFLKPKFSLKMRGQRVRLDENADGEVDENFWAQAAVDQAAGRNGEGDGEDSGDGQIPFNTQFFHDDDDDFGDGFDGEPVSTAGADAADPSEQDLLAATAGQTRRVRPEFINYAKRAKRVDVRKLKDNIWKGLDILVPEADPNKMDMDEDEKPLEGGTDPTEAREFSSVVSGLRASYPKEKMEEISTSFCFICLLHLANERGLKLETGDNGIAAIQEADEDDFNGGNTIDEKVGNIWGVKIYRDPYATPAA